MGRGFFQDRKKIIIEVVIGVIIALSILGNVYALFSSQLQKAKDDARAAGFTDAVAQIIRQGNACVPVNLPGADGAAESFVNIKCLQAPDGGGAAGAPGAPGARAAAPAGGARAMAPAGGARAAGPAPAPMPPPPPAPTR